jgi:WD40 repeat protein
VGVIFISHSSRNNPQAIEVRDWLRSHGWRDTFLDLDPAHGLAPGQRWQEELKKAGERCSAVIVLISPEWVASKWCQVEFLLASQLGKRIFGVIITPTDFGELPSELTAHYQLTDISAPARARDGFERLRWGLKRAGLHPGDFPWPPPDELQRSPYRGLRSLEEKDAGVFFGRDAPITRGLDTLRRMRDGAPERLLVILGASGAGKSSFLKAGLLARLRRDEEHFLVLPTVRPARAALTGPEGLLHALGVKAIPASDALERRLGELRAPIVDRLKRFARAARETYGVSLPTLVLPIDQAEELFGSDSTESPAFFAVLRQALEIDNNLVGVLTIRSDSYAHLQAERQLAEIPRLPFDLPPLSPGAFKEVIEGPGRLASPTIVFEPALTDRLVADLDRADVLPLLAFTLERLVGDYGADFKIELVEYEQRLGGLAGAIEKAIEAAFDSAMADPSLPRDRPALEALARRAFIPWLVKLDDVEGVARRRVAAMGELPEETRRLVVHFVNQRLLVSDTKADGHTIEVSHESIFRHWAGLSHWIDEERVSLLALEAARSAAAEWHRQVTARGVAASDEWLIHRGERLTRAEALLHRPDYALLLTAADAAYLTACRERERSEQAEAEEQIRREREQFAREQRLQRRATLAMGLVALMIIAFAGFAVVQARRASRQASLAMIDYAQTAMTAGEYERAARFAVLAAREGPLTAAAPTAASMLSAAASHSSLLLMLAAGSGETSWSTFPDGRRALSSGGDGTVAVWDLTSGRRIAQHTHQGEADAIVSCDGNRVLSWADDGTVSLWDGTMGREIARRTQPRPVDHALFSADGSKLLFWGDDAIVRVWDATSGGALAQLAHDRIDSAVFSADGRWVLSSSADWPNPNGQGTVRVWDASSGGEIARQTHGGGGVFGAALSVKSSRILSYSKDGIVRLWDATSGREVSRHTHGAGFPRAIFAADGRYALSWGDDGAVLAWDAVSGRQVARQTHIGGVGSAVFSANGMRVLSWGKDGSVRLWEVSTGREIARHSHQSVVGAALSVDEARVLSWDSEGTVRVWNTASGEQVARQTHEGGVQQAVYSADGKRVLSWSDDGTVRAWYAASGHEVARQIHEGGVVDARFIGDGRRVLSYGHDGVARIWDASGGEVARTTHSLANGMFGGAAFSAEGDRVLSWGGDGTVRVWDSDSGRELARQRVDGWLVEAVFTHDFARVLSWGLPGTPVLWDGRSGREIAHISDLADPIRGSPMFAAAAPRVLAWHRDGTVRVWDAATGQQVTSVKHQSGPVGAILTADGKRVLSWEEDGAARVWEADSGREIARFGDEGDIAAATFSADGRRILSWSSKGTLRVWDASLGREVSRFVDEDMESPALSADGSRVLSSGGQMVYLWDAASGREIARFTYEGATEAFFSSDGSRVLSWEIAGPVHLSESATGRTLQMQGSGTVGGVFSEDARRVLSWDTDGVARVWNASDGRELARLNGVGSAAISADGTRVVSWGHDGFVRVWDATFGIELARHTDENKTFKAAFARDGKRVLSYSIDNGTVSTWNASWLGPQHSSRALIGEVCQRTLREPEMLAATSARERGPETVTTHTSLRRISASDALAAPILRDRIGQDVCASSRSFSEVVQWVRRAFSK